MSHHLLQTALDWHRAGRAVAVATVVETWGSAPRGVGSLLIIDADGHMEGSVSGGCVEGAVIMEALDAIPSGDARLLDYGARARIGEMRKAVKRAVLPCDLGAGLH